MSVKRWMVFSIFFLLAAILLAAVLTPSLRQSVQLYLSKPGREVLATAEGDLLGDGQMAKVIKYRAADLLYVEVVKENGSGATTLIDRLLLPDKHDGLFNYQGHVTRLAIVDVDGDGSMELLAPSFDNQLVPHLNVFRYNPAIKRFELMSPPAP